MNLSTQPRLAIFAALAALMALTRIHHFGPLPDASWAIFFAGGFYLRGLARWAFPALMLEAVAMDWLATQHLGVSSYCVTVAYWAVLPGYGALWFGGLWLRRAYRGELRDLARLVASVFVAVTACYFVTNGAFYWFGGRYPEPNVTQYVERFFTDYRHFLLVPAAYLAVAAALHVVAQRVLPELLGGGRAARR